MINKNIDASLGFLLNKTTLVYQRELNRNFLSAGFDITNEQWSILIYLFNCDGKSQNEIAEKTYKDKVSVTKIIDSLEKRELVYRTNDVKDRRVKRVYISPKGKETVPKLKKVLKTTIEKAFKGTEDKDLESFKTVLSNLVFNFTNVDIIKFIKENKERWIKR